MSDVEVFEAHRGTLFGVAYRMLGSVAEAEDIVQETWLRWDRVDHDTVQDPRAYLVRIATRAALDHLRRASTVRETYVGPWLPEPLVTDPVDASERTVVEESVSMALLVVLETLSPAERAVFVLREAFGFHYPEIAAALGRSEAATRQLGHRAREHVQARRPRFATDRATRTEATTRFLHAAMGGDLEGLLAILAPDVELLADGGGLVKAPRRPVRSADKVARFFVAVSDDAPPGSVPRWVDVNGAPAVVLTVGDVPVIVASVEVDAATGLIARVQLIGNPEKLSRMVLP